MSKLKVLCGIAVIGLVAGCGGSSRSPKVAGAPARADGRIVVREFDMAGTTIKNYNAETDGFGVKMAQKIAEQLSSKGLRAEAVTRGASVPEGASVVQGEIMKLDGGNRAARYVVGFGAGGASLTVKGAMVGGDGRQVGEFTSGRNAAFGMFGGDTVALVNRCVESVAGDVATMISTGKYEKTAR